MADLRKVKLKENKKIENWNSVDFSFYIKRMNIKFYKKIGNEFLMPIMVIASKIKVLLFSRFFNLGKSKKNIREYLLWFYENKSRNFNEPPEIYILASYNFIYEWLKNKNQKADLSGGYSGLRKF